MSVLNFMTVKINYNDNLLKKNSYNLVLFVDENFNISSLKKHLLRQEYIFISDLLRVRDNKKIIISFHISSKKKNNFNILKKKTKKLRS